VCPVEVLCVGACVYNHWNRTPPIAIGRLQRYAVEHALTNGNAAELLERATPNGKRVACVGGGPASLAAAGYLALEGVSVTVFERRRLAGGLNMSGVAPYKMHVPDALREVEFIRSLGVVIRDGVEVGRDLAPATLLTDFDAVFLGVGLGADTRLGIPGEDGASVFGATGWIERLKLEPGFALGAVQRGVVVGGGNTAIDAARELAQLGVPHVTLAYRRRETDMSGYVHELAHARHEGVQLLERAVPKQFVRDPAGRLTALRLEDGRDVPCDVAIVAIGQSRLRELVAQFPGVGLTAGGHVEVDASTGRTGNPKVFAGGDVLGGELVVTAVQEAKRAARAICEMLDVPVRAEAPMRAGHV
jgi:glutamate synthase (NADPH/NADH) small chain